MMTTAVSQLLIGFSVEREGSYGTMICFSIHPLNLVLSNCDSKSLSYFEKSIFGFCLNMMKTKRKNAKSRGTTGRTLMNHDSSNSIYI